VADTARGAKLGMGLGLLAGLVFVAVEIGFATASGLGPAWPFRLFSSVALGRDALDLLPADDAILLGTSLHVVLSALYGIAYGVYNAALIDETRTAWLRQSLIGTGFGVLLWVMNVQVLALSHFPWFLELPQGPQLVMHALGFGLPLGLLYAAVERRFRLAPLAWRP